MGETDPGGPEDRLLSWPRVREITGLSRTTAWRMQNAGDFPKPVRISPGRVGWWVSELDAWKAARGRTWRPRAAAPRPRPHLAVPAPSVVAPSPIPPAASAAGTAPARPRRAEGPSQLSFEF